MSFATVPGHHARLRLPDGRHLAFASYGPDDGRFVIFVPGAGTGRLMQFGGPLLVERRIRLVVPDRPGLGCSDPHPGKSFSSVAADLRALTVALGDAPVPVVANSQGAPFGLAAAIEGVASRLVLVSPSDEVADPRVRDQLPADLRTLVEHVGSVSPAAAAATFADFTANALLALILTNAAAVDAEAYSDPDFRRLLEQALRDGFAPGSAGYAADTVLAMRPWQLDLQRISIPVSIWFGVDDAIHSPDHGRGLASRIPGCEHHVIDHAGGALLWNRPELILTEALR